MKNSINLQDTFLNTCRKNKTSITVFLVNGFQIKGVVKGFDNYVVMIEGEGKQNFNLQTCNFNSNTSRKCKNGYGSSRGLNK